MNPSVIKIGYHRNREIHFSPQKRKTIGFKPLNQNTILVFYPKSLPASQIIALLDTHWHKVEKALANYEKMEKEVAHHQGKQGEELRLWKKEKEALLQKEMAYLVEKTKLIPAYCKVKEVKSIWGSCTGKKGINLNLHLVYCPKPVRFYVMIHERCHLKQPNHQQAFWSMVQSFDGCYKEHRKWLRQYGNMILALPLGCENVAIGANGQP